MDTPCSLKYDLCLGYGSFGIVLRAVGTTQNESIPNPSDPLAVKFLFPDDNDERERQLILRECKISLGFEKHENIVQVFKVIEKKFSGQEIEEIFSDDVMTLEDQRSLRDRCIWKARRFNGLEMICLQMELCAENLRHWLNQRPDISQETVQHHQLQIVCNLMSGLKFLHDNKIIHRDLKPENIMFAKEGFILPVKLGDFGLSRKIHSEESKSSSLTSGVGTRNYMAPEILTRQNYSFQADLYSLGLIIWEVVQFVRSNQFERLVYDKEENLVDTHPLMGRHIKDFIIGLTKRKPDHRLKSLDAVKEIRNKWEDMITKWRKLKPPSDDPSHSSQDKDEKAKFELQELQNIYQKFLLKKDQLSPGNRDSLNKIHSPWDDGRILSSHLQRLVQLQELGAGDSTSERDESLGLNKMEVEVSKEWMENPITKSHTNDSIKEPGRDRIPTLSQMLAASNPLSKYGVKVFPDNVLEKRKDLLPKKPICTHCGCFNCRC